MALTTRTTPGEVLQAATKEAMQAAMTRYTLASW